MRNEYTAKVNRVIDYIDNNLNGELTLSKLSSIASYSDYHFHRIFKTLIGESVNSYIRRIRIEKSANLLIRHPHRSITDIAFDCGFSSSQFFSRTFKKYYSQNASDWRKEKTLNGKIVKEGKSSIHYIDHRNRTRVNVVEAKSIEIKELKDIHTAYIRHIGSYSGKDELPSELFTKLSVWAQARNLIRFYETKFISLYHDDPDITEASKLRFSACISVPEDTPVNCEIGYLTIKGGEYAVANFELNADELNLARKYVYDVWLPQRGYQPDGKPYFKEMLNDPDEHPEQKHIVNIYVPVKPL